MKNIRTRSFFLVLIYTLGLYGCAGVYSVVEFEVLEPATVNFPNHIDQFLILNRAPFTLDVFSEDDRMDMEDSHLSIVDTLIINSILRGVQSILRQSPIERFHNPFYTSDRRTDTVAMADLILTKREVNDYCKNWIADAVISLEFYSMDLDEKIDYFIDAPRVIQNHYYQVSNIIKWSIHLPDSPKAFDNYTTIDTMYFMEILDGEFTQIQSVARMISESFYNSGSKYGKYLVPRWSHASRILYKGKEDSLKLASNYTDGGDWETALVIWEDLALAADSTLVCKAFHNMAVYYELEDNLDSASLLVNQALEYDTLEAVRLYREELDIRLLNRNEVLKQVY